MNNEYVVNLKDVYIEENHPYTLIFKGYVRNRLCTFVFDGNIRDTDASMTDEVKEDFAKQLSVDYGHGMFNENKVRKQLEKKFQYRMKM